MAGLGDLVVRLSAETAQFTQALDKASYQSQKSFDKMVSSAKTAGIAIGAAFAVSEFTAMTRKALAFADQMQDVATANEVGVESILALSEALTQNGGKAENAGKMLSSLNAKIYEAAEGSKTAQEAFKGAGISMGDLSKLSTIDLFDKLINKIAETKDASLRNGMAMEFFGKAAKGVDFVGLAQGTDEARAKFLEYASAIKTSADLNDKLEAKTMKTMVMFNTTFIPTMNAIVDSANQGGSAFESLMTFGGEAFKGLVYGLRTVVTGLQTVNASVNLVGLTLSDIGSGKFNTFFDRLKEYDAYVANLRSKDKEFARELMSNNKTNKKALEDTANATRNIKTPKEDLAGIASAIEANKKYSTSMAELVAKKQLAMATPFISEEEKKLQEDMIAIQKAFNDAQAGIIKLYNEGKLPQSQYQAELEKLGSTYESTILKTQELFDKQQQLNGSWEYGASTALAKYVNESRNLARATEGVVLGAMKGLEDSLLGLISRTTTVAQAFKSMTASILSDIAKILIRQSITAPIANALAGAIGSAFSSSTINLGSSTSGASLGGVGSSTSSGVGINPNASLSGIRASGGSVGAGNSYLVGEMGAEVFTPNSNGYITPNNKLGGSTNVVVNVNMAEGTTTASDANQLGIMIGNVVKAELVKQKRAGGLLA